MSHIPLHHHKHHDHHEHKHKSKKTLHVKRIAQWLPPHKKVEGWLAELLKEARERVHKGDVKLSPAVTTFYNEVQKDPVLWMYFVEMIAQPVVSKPYEAPEAPFNTVEELFVAMDTALIKGPKFDETVLVGCPLNGVLDYCMATPAGYAVFRDRKLNVLMKALLQEWCKFLSSPESCSVLDGSENGWLSEQAKAKMNFQWYQHDPSKPYHGFTSWNDFFTRRFVDGLRPVECKDDNKAIVSACESTPYCIHHNVKRRDQFWLKEQPYSLVDMLDQDELTEQFVGGSIYQAFLSALEYHRWHSPVKGTVVKITHVDGTYFSEAESEGFDLSGPDHSEGYITSVATRAIIYIQAEDPTIGLMCIIFVGMGEVSSCVFLDHIKAGYKVEKGEEIGFFQFGGSTHCLVFRPGAIKQFEVVAPGDKKVHLNTVIATAN